MNEQQVRKIVRQEIKKHDERQSSDIDESDIDEKVSAAIRNGIQKAAIGAKNHLDW